MIVTPRSSAKRIGSRSCFASYGLLPGSLAESQTRVRAELGKFGRGKHERLIVGQVELQIANLVKPAEHDALAKNVDVVVAAGAIDQQTAKRSPGSSRSDIAGAAAPRIACKSETVPIATA